MAIFSKIKTYRSGILISLGLLLILFGFRPWYGQIAWYLSPQANEDTTSEEDTLLTFDVGDVPMGEDMWSVTTSTQQILIPSIGVDMKIVSEEGISEQEAFARGAWLLPRTSEPNRVSGNTVIAAHRYLYTSGPNTFYHLDKLSVGDDIIVEWRGKRFVYIVTGSKVVPPTDVDILSQTDEPMLTLFTCTPVFTSKNRLVVTAKLST